MQGVRNILERNTRCQQFEALVRRHIVPAYSQYVLSQPSRAVVPTLAEIVLSEQFLPILGNHLLNPAPPDGIFDNALAGLPELMRRWNSEMAEVPIQVLRKSAVYFGKAIPDSVLSYASTVFSCRKCCEALTHPTLFVHECFLQQVSPKRAKRNSKKIRIQNHETEPPTPEGVLGREALDDVARHVFQHTRSWQPGSNLVFHDPAYHHTVALLDSLGLERTTTAEELHQLNPSLECRCACFQAKRGEAMSWTRAVSCRCISCLIPESSPML